MDNIIEGKIRCRWCGELTSQDGQFCTKCDRPIKRFGYGISIGKIVLSLTIPLAIAIVGLQFNISQGNLEKSREVISSKIEDRRRLAEAYTKLNNSIGRFRAATVHIETACQSDSNDSLCFSQLNNAALEIDSSLTDIGSHLAPFIEYESRMETAIKNASRSLNLEIDATWQRCFVDPYYKGSFFNKSLWQMLNEIFSDGMCTEHACGYKAAMAAKSIVGRIWRGQCVDSKPERYRPLVWFSHASKKLYTKNIKSNDESVNEKRRDLVVNDGLSPDVSEWMEIIWNHYNSKEYQDAIKLCKSYSQSRLSIASEQQKRLKKVGIILQEGEVHGLDREITFANAELNNVATCFLINGWSNAALGLDDAAESSYISASKLPDARTWDLNGWFWSPARVADEELKKYDAKK